MTIRVDFYILPDVDVSARARFTCRLAYKAAAAGLRVHVHTGSLAESNDLDALMWDYPSYQFLPHCLAEEPEAESAPVTVGHGSTRIDRDQLLINLNDAIPEFFGRFDRVAEIVVEHQRPQMRDHYRFYRNRGYALYHHEMNQWEDQ
jgi:DNA polymerase IIIc chi subunit